MYSFAPIPASVIFPNSKNDFTELKSILRSINLNQALAWCSHLNFLLSNKKFQIDQTPLIADFFNDEQRRSIDRWIKRLNTGQGSIVFHRGQILELVKWGCLYCNNTVGSIENPDDKQKFAHAALIASELWLNRNHKLQQSRIDNLPITGRRKDSLPFLRQTADDSSHRVDMGKALDRGKILFIDILKKNHPEFENQFQDIANLPIADYFVILDCIRDELDKDVVISKSKFLEKFSDLRKSFESFILSESQTPSELKTALWGSIQDRDTESELPNHKPLRDRPIIKFSDDHYMVIDLTFFTDKASVGPLFYLLRDTNNRASKIFDDFGKAFEKYACGILRRVYPNSDHLADRFKHPYKGESRSGGVEIADAILQDVNQTVLFEMKAKWLQDAITLAGDNDKFIEHLIKKYTNDKSEFQLATGIAKLASNKYIPEDGWEPAGRIFPILVCHDSLMDILGYPWEFSELFTSQLIPDTTPAIGDMTKGRYHVASLIIITLDVLEDLEDLVRKYNLCDLLSDYSANCHDRTVSLQEYISSSKYNDFERRVRVVEITTSNS